MQNIVLPSSRDDGESVSCRPEEKRAHSVLTKDRVPGVLRDFLPYCSTCKGTRTVPLRGGAASLAPGDIVAYEFVSADRKWRWALGTVVSLDASPRMRGGEEGSRSGGDSPSGIASQMQQHEQDLIVTVKDWALSQESGRPRRIVIRRQKHETKQSPTDSSASVRPCSNDSVGCARRCGTRAAGEKASPNSDSSLLPAQQQGPASASRPEKPYVDVFVDDAATEEVARALTFTEIAWDNLTEIEYFHWESMMRLEADAVPEETRLSVLGFLVYLGALPRGSSSKASSELADNAIFDVEEQFTQWDSLVTALKSDDFAERAREFFLETISSDVVTERSISRAMSPDVSMGQTLPTVLPLRTRKRVCSTNGVAFHTMTPDQRAVHNYVKRNVLQCSRFRYNQALCTSTLTGRLFKCVESFLRLFDSLDRLEQAEEEKLREREGKVRAAVCRSQRPPQFLIFTESATTTTTVCSSVFCKLEGACLMHDSIVLSKADVEAIGDVALGTTVQGSCDSHSQSLECLDSVEEAAGMAAVSQSEWATRQALLAEAAEERANLLQEALVTAPVSGQSCVTGTSLPPVDEIILSMEDSSRSHSGSGDDAESDLITKIHRYATDLEEARYQLRLREAGYIRVADTLQTALIDLYQSHHPFEHQLKALVENVEAAADALVGDVRQSEPRRVTPLPGDLRASIDEHFHEVKARSVSLCAAQHRDGDDVTEREPSAGCADRPSAEAVGERGDCSNGQARSNFAPDARHSDSFSLPKALTYAQETHDPSAHTRNCSSSFAVRDAASFSRDAQPVTCVTSAHTVVTVDVETADSSMLTCDNERKDAADGPPVDATAGLSEIVTDSPAYAVCQVSPSSIADEATPRAEPVVTWSERATDRYSDFRYEELERQEKEIVRLTSALCEERKKRVLSEQKRQELEGKVANARVAQDLAAQSAAAAGKQPTVNGPWAAMMRGIRQLHDALQSRADNAVANTDSDAARLDAQIDRLKDEMSGSSPTLEEDVAMGERRAAVLEKQKLCMQAERAHLVANAQQLREMNGAIGRLAETAQFHDERWALPPVQGEHLADLYASSSVPERKSSTTRHTKLLPGAAWETCLHVHRYRAHEAAVSDVANAVHVADSAVVLKCVDASDTGLTLGFDITHDNAVSVKALDYRLQNYPFRSLLDLYEHRDAPPEGSDALLADISELRERLDAFNDIDSAIAI